MPLVSLSKRAERELDALPPSVRARVAEVLHALRVGVDLLHVKALRGHRPWLRIRVGDYRLIFRRVTASGFEEIEVARIVDRKNLERAIRSLD